MVSRQILLLTLLVGFVCLTSGAEIRKLLDELLEGMYPGFYCSLITKYNETAVVEVISSFEENNIVAIVVKPTMESSSNERKRVSRRQMRTCLVWFVLLTCRQTP